MSTADELAVAWLFVVVAVVLIVVAVVEVVVIVVVVAVVVVVVLVVEVVMLLVIEGVVLVFGVGVFFACLSIICIITVIIDSQRRIASRVRVIQRHSLLMLSFVMNVCRQSYTGFLCLFQ